MRDVRLLLFCLIMGRCGGDVELPDLTPARLGDTTGLVARGPFMSFQDLRR